MTIKIKTTFCCHALTYGSYVSFCFDLYSLSSNCLASAFLIGEEVVHYVGAMLSNVIDEGIRRDYQVWQTLEG